MTPPDNASRIPCRYCAAPLAAADVNVQLAIAKCSNCQAVYSFADEVKERAETRARAPVSLPARFTVKNESGTLTITRKWFSPAAFFLVFFCVFWDGFLVVWYAGAIASGNLVMAIFPLLHVAVGVGLTYTTLTMFVNSTVISAARGLIGVKHGPLPWKGNLELKDAGLKQLWCVQKVRNGKNGPSYSYEVHAKGSDGREHVVLKGLDDTDQALFIEQQIEKHLRIEDRPVAGELAR